MNRQLESMRKKKIGLDFRLKFRTRESTFRVQKCVECVFAQLFLIRFHTQFEFESHTNSFNFSVIMEAPIKLKLGWRLPLCGGFLIHGSNDCVLDENTNLIICKCPRKPSNFNYEVHFVIAQAVFAKKMHLNKNGDSWDAFALTLFSDNGGFKKYTQVQGKTLKERFFHTMVEEVSKRHGVGEFADGREAHPDVTPYDNLMLKMVEEMTKQEQAKKSEADKKSFKNSSMLAHEKTLCPVVNMTKKTKAVLDEEGEEIEPEFHLEILPGATPSAEDGSGSGSNTGSSNKKKRQREGSISSGSNLESSMNDLRDIMQIGDEELEIKRREVKLREREMKVRERDSRTRARESQNQQAILQYFMQQRGFQMSAYTIRGPSCTITADEEDEEDSEEG